MTEPVPSSVAVKRRQYLLLAGVGAVIVIGTVFSVSLTGSKPATERQSKPKSTNILAPGARSIRAMPGVGKPTPNCAQSSRSRASSPNATAKWKVRAAR
jgi:hypothetical protein